MSPDASLEIQWFVYALASNGLMTDDDAEQLWLSLNQTQDLGEFAEAVIDRLTQSMSLEEQDQFVEQIQQLVDYACTQAQISSINSYEDLPGFSDLATVSDEEVRQRMIMLLSGLRCPASSLPTERLPLLPTAAQPLALLNLPLAAQSHRAKFSLASPVQICIR